MKARPRATRKTVLGQRLSGGGWVFLLKKRREGEGGGEGGGGAGTDTGTGKSMRTRLSKLPFSDLPLAPSKFGVSS